VCQQRSPHIEHRSMGLSTTGAASSNGGITLGHLHAPLARRTGRIALAALFCACLLAGAQRRHRPTLSVTSSLVSVEEAAHLPKTSGPVPSPASLLELVVRGAPQRPCEAIVNGRYFSPPPKIIPTRPGLPTTVVLACDGYQLEQHVTLAEWGEWVLTPRRRQAKTCRTAPPGPLEAVKTQQTVAH
jgi:hypothetical protein